MRNVRPRLFKRKNAPLCSKRFRKHKSSPKLVWQCRAKYRTRYSKYAPSADKTSGIKSCCHPRKWRKRMHPPRKVTT